MPKLSIEVEKFILEQIKVGSRNRRNSIGFNQLEGGRIVPKNLD